MKGRQVHLFHHQIADPLSTRNLRVIDTSQARYYDWLASRIPIRDTLKVVRPDLLVRPAILIMPLGLYNFVIDSKQ